MNTITVEDAKELANVKIAPGQIISFSCAKLYFLDRTIPEQEAVFNSMFVDEKTKYNYFPAARWAISPTYLTESVSQTRWALVITYVPNNLIKDQDAARGEMKAFSLIADRKKDATSAGSFAGSIEGLLVCAEKSYDGKDPSLRTGEVKLGYGGWLSAIFTEYLTDHLALGEGADSKGNYQYISLSASTAELIPYYAGRGYRLGLNPEGEDPITVEHESARKISPAEGIKYEKNFSVLYPAYSTSHGYYMWMSIKDLPLYAKSQRMDVEKRFTQYWSMITDKNSKLWEQC